MTRTPLWYPVTRDAEVEPQFSQPARQIIFDAGRSWAGWCGAVFYIGFAQLDGDFLVEPLSERGAFWLVFMSWGSCRALGRWRS